MLGLHKLNTGYYASSWILEMRKGNFDLGEFKNHPNYKDVRPRIANYEFIYEIFYKDKVKICILDKDLSRNTMRLSVVFYKNKDKKVVVLGLKKR
ncbi:hypothetical protein [Streptococcus cuniculi]|uniref:hypothetical protein n=1 Tax=Streptococcus cuniculi TaxID=1432788 RepID=UPI001D169F7E|nr:hypothetical protein [Streptococcus cuniculi]